MLRTTSFLDQFSSLIKSPIKYLFIYIILYRLVCAAILLWGSYYPPFDSSHVVLWPTLATDTESIFNRFISTAVRWDVFHFHEIAKNGYTYEHLYAFPPGMATIMRITSSIFGYGSTSGMLWGYWIAVVFCSTLHTLYEFTLLQTKSPEMASLAAACSLLPSSPATLIHAPYAEPFFTFLSFKGGLHSSCMTSSS